MGCVLQLCELNLSAIHWSPLLVGPKYRLLPLSSQDVACRYEGSWVKGVREGQGKCKYANGDVYDGAWSADVRAGPGSCNYENGDKYTGARPVETPFPHGVHAGLRRRPMSWASARRKTRRDQYYPQEACCPMW